MNHDEHNDKHKENPEMNHSKMDMTKEGHSKMDHSKMNHDHGAIPMGMAGHDHHRMMIEDFKSGFGLV